MKKCPERAERERKRPAEAVGKTYSSPHVRARARVCVPFQTLFFRPRAGGITPGTGRALVARLCIGAALCMRWAPAHNELYFSQPAEHRLSYFLYYPTKKKKEVRHPWCVCAHFPSKGTSGFAARAHKYSHVYTCAHLMGPACAVLLRMFLRATVLVRCKGDVKL